MTNRFTFISGIFILFYLNVREKLLRLNRVVSLKIPTEGTAIIYHYIIFQKRQWRGRSNNAVDIADTDKTRAEQQRDG